MSAPATHNFNVLDPQESIHESMLLEASAGTGKTFAIENLIVRLLLEEDPLPIENVLAVTFTKAAARDLKTRVRSNIETSLFGLNQRLKGEEVTLAPYLEVYQTKEAIQFARRCLEHALFCFDRAQIFTIHSFCRRMLSEYLFEGNFFPHSGELEDLVPNQHVLKAVRDYFRTEVKRPEFSPGEIEQVIAYHRGSIERVEKELVRSVLQGGEFAKVPSYQERYNDFKKRFSKCELTYDDLIALSSNYKNICDRSRKIKKENEELFEKFAFLFSKKNISEEDFETFLRDFSEMETCFSEKNLKKGAPDLPADHPIACMSAYLQPLIPFCRMAHGVKKLVNERIQEDQFFSCDELLTAMRKAIDNPSFRSLVQNRFRAAIIDEFQDTDPVQWEIFKRLFVNDSTLLYLVGDPKQSIYAFRQADIYTYRKAALVIQRQATLATNYRSQSSLVQGLNALFSEADSLFPLPRENEMMDFSPVNATDRIAAVPFTDGKGSVHFWIAEEKSSMKQLEGELFFPLIVNEIRNGGGPYSKYAVLVADKWQTERLIDYFNMWKIPSFSERAQNLTETLAYQSLVDVITAIQDCFDFSAVKKACGSLLIGMTLEESEVTEEVLFQFQKFRQVLYKEGFESLYFQLLHTCWKGGKAALEKILEQEQGISFYQDLQQLSEIVFEAKPSPDGLLKLLKDLPLLDLDEKLKKRAKAESDAVTIITIHKAKGLEFDVVFALGLVKQTPDQKSLIPFYNQGVRVQTPPLGKQDSRLIDYYNEQDAEKMRQLYVAMTRAKYRLFCPAISKGMSETIGKISPMGLFLQKCSIQEVSKKCPHVTFESIAEESIAVDTNVEQINPTLIPPKIVAINTDTKMITSFSALAAKGGQVRGAQAPKDFNEKIKTPHTLPAGSETGTLLHVLLETLKFENLTFDSLLIHTKMHVQNTKFEIWNEVIASMIWDAVTLDLGGFQLIDVDPKKILRETSFLFPIENNYLKGVVDLVFEHNEKYYLLDWKSNWLGKDIDSYHFDSLDLAMKENDYYLQLKTYKEALKRWLFAHHLDSFDALFGNGIYLFLRGGKQGLWKEK